YRGARIAKRRVRVQGFVGRQETRDETPGMRSDHPRRQAGIRPGWARLFGGASVKALLLAAYLSTAHGQEIYDLLLKSGNVIDPANRRNGRMDVAVIDGKITRVGTGLPASQARVVIEASRYYVVPGLIDIRAHFGAGGVLPDYNSLPSGVTTA